MTMYVRGPLIYPLGGKINLGTQGPTGPIGPKGDKGDPGIGSVLSVFGRTGIVAAALNDYTFSQIGSKPTTLAGYGITDAYPLSGNPSGFLTSVPAQSFASLTGKPTTVGGYGITDVLSQLITGYVSGAGVISATDSILQAIQKLNGNIAGGGVTVGSSTQSGTVSATTFNIAHGLGSIPNYFNVTANTSDAQGIAWVTADGTNIVVHYNTAPPVGSNNLIFKWIAK